MARPASDAGPQGFGLRLISALVLAPAALALAWAGGVAFNLLVLAAAAWMAVEWNGLCNRGARESGIALAAATVAAVAVAAWGHPGYALAAAAPAVALVFAVARAAGRRAWWSAAGVVYVAVPCIALIWLRAAPAIGLAAIVWLFAVVWATDIGAYVAGRGIGGPRLWPRVSPKKTWAGLVGGVACAAAAGFAAALVLGLPERAPLVGLSALMALVAQGGDLFESMVKRRFGAKDSGRVIPGHGGVLDRLDGFMTAAPAAAVAALASQGSLWAWR